MTSSVGTKGRRLWVLGWDNERVGAVARQTKAILKSLNPLSVTCLLLFTLISYICT